VDQTPLDAPPAMAVPDGAFVDLVFFISHHERSRAFLEATHNGEPVQLTLRLADDWELNDYAGMKTWNGWVQFESASDNLGPAICAAFNSPIHPNGVTSAQMNATCLQGDPTLETEDVVKMKVFLYPDGDEESYAEFFIVLNPAARRVTMGEKDSDYRAALLRGLTL